MGMFLIIAATVAEANVPAGLCKCYASPISLLYWFAAGCGFDCGEISITVVVAMLSM